MEKIGRVFVFPGIFALLFIQSGCLYTNVRGPRAYRSATPGDVKTAAADPVVTGTACNRSVLYLFAWGDAGYASAARAALKDHPEGILYDVKTDVKATAVLLGLYARACTVLTARVGRE